MSGFEINGRQIGGGAAPFIIAEVGINHGGDGDVAMRLLEAAARAGADAVKLQTFETARFLSRSSEFFEVLHACELPRESVAALMHRARDLKVTVFSACFDEKSADLLNDLGAPAYKVASGDITHIPLLRHVAAFGKPMIVSTGGATLDEVTTAVAAIRGVTPDLPIALMHCVSNYPTDPKDVNLACMTTMRDRFDVPVGFSDHTLGNATAIGAVALGAELIEKHFTLDRSMDGPDHALSADPESFAELVQSAVAASQVRGSAEKKPVEAADFIPQLRRSVTAGRDIPRGTTISEDMLEIKRPGTGIQPAEIHEVVGCRAIRDLAVDETLQWSDIESAS